MPSDPTHPKLLYIAGNNGSGKSTLSKKLAGRLGFQHRTEHQYDETYLSDLFEQQRRWSFETQIHFLALKVATVRSALSDSARAVIDRSPYEDAEVFARYFYETGNMDRRSYRTYQQLYETLLKDLPEPALILYCRCSVAELSRRVAGRGRQYEELYPPDHLKLLESLYQGWLARIARRFPGRVLTIDSEAIDFRADDRAIDQVAFEVQDALESPQLSLSFDGTNPPLWGGTSNLLKRPVVRGRPKTSRRIPVAYLAAPFTGKATEPLVPTDSSAHMENDDALFSLSKIRPPVHGRIADAEYRLFLESVEQIIRSCGYDVFLPHRDINRWGDRVLSPKRAASECTRHVFSADVLIALPQLSLGAHYEIGVAIGYGLPVLVLIQGDEPTGFLTPGLSSVGDTTVVPFDGIEGLRARLSALLNDLAKHLKH